MSRFNSKSCSNFLDVFYTKLRLEYMLSTKNDYIYKKATGHKQE